MSFLSKAFRRKSEGLPPWAALDQEALRISAAMEHVQDHGNLDAFPGNQNEKLALMLTASRQGLVTWNRAMERYELTSLGRERLGMRQALQESGGPMKMNLPPASAAPAAPAGRWALGSGTMMAGVAGLAIGAVAMALLPGSSAKAPPRDKAAVATASKPADASNPPRQVYPQAQTAAPASTQPPAPASSQPEPPKPQAPQQAAIHPGEAGAAAGALAQELTIAGAEPAPTASAEASPAPAPQPQRRTAERSRKYQAAPSAPVGPEQPGFARAPEEPSAGATDKSSRSRVATEPQKSWSESKRKTGKSRREYATQDEGAPREGVTVRRYEEDDGPPVMMMRRHRGEPSLRRGGDEEARPGYARRESPTFSYRDRDEGRPRFGLFDWLFR